MNGMPSVKTRIGMLLVETTPSIASMARLTKTALLPSKREYLLTAPLGAVFYTKNEHLHLQMLIFTIHSQL